MKPLLLIAVVPLAVVAASAVGGYQQWRADYEKSLRAPDGWLSVAGLSWLHEGANAVELPPGAGKGSITLNLKGKTATFEGRTLKSDETEHPDVLRFNGVTVTIIERDGKTGVRLRDPNAETRRDFTGCKWFPADEGWRVNAKWVPYAKPKSIAITNILGMTDQEPSPGFAEFAVKGQPVRLEPVVEDNELFFMFKDTTSSSTTYGAGRFLYADMPKGDRVELDFNKAHNPPCAFTAYATCPLPPKQNVLTVAIPAGEMRYASH